ncbi:hypothetical protein B0T16DRAFT_6048 [Cercophora newfieldiana]|uniref:C2H2-type domain-containing protein n=1 Tax=Cercophora newfieldiana TaxID=92897 RepID=A0AA40CZV7_9PEZI|nr:hypothetical protein B0T16DRAFT_6048 [Cercophora newfieldiana]
MSPSAPFSPSQAPLARDTALELVEGTASTQPTGGSVSGILLDENGLPQMDDSRRAIQEFRGALQVAAASLGEQLGEPVSPMMEGILSTGDRVIHIAQALESQARTLAAERHIRLRKERQLTRILAGLTSGLKGKLLKCQQCRIQFETPDQHDIHDEQYHRDKSPTAATAPPSTKSSYNPPVDAMMPPAPNTISGQPSAHDQPGSATLVSDQDAVYRRQRKQHINDDRRPSDPHPLPVRHQAAHERRPPPKRRCSEQHFSNSTPQPRTAVSILPASAPVQRASSRSNFEHPVSPPFVFGRDAQHHAHPGQPSAPPIQHPHQFMAPSHPTSPPGVVNGRSGIWAHDPIYVINAAHFEEPTAPTFQHIDWPGTVPGETSSFAPWEGMAMETPRMPSACAPYSVEWVGETPSFMRSPADTATPFASLTENYNGHLDDKQLLPPGHYLI